MPAQRRFIATLCGLAAVLGVVSLRFSRPEFRAWELVRQKDGFLFEPGRRVEMEEIGDLGYKSWVRAVQRPRRVTFTTDRWGFRNPRDMERPVIVVVGDSYTVGTGVSDPETLPERLSRRLGIDVYNYGLEIAGASQLFLADQRFLKAPPRLVVYAPVNRNMRPRSVMLPGNRWPDPDRPRGLIGTWRAVDQTIHDLFSGLNRDNALAVEARYAFNGLRYRAFGLPNEVVFEGQRLLRLTVQEQLLEVPPRERQPEQVAATVIGFREELARRRIELLFCPLPEVGAIYPDLYSPEDRALIQQPSMLDLVIAHARRGGVATVDLRGVFRNNRSPYLFLPDDSHWNARAIDLAAQVLEEAVRTGVIPVASP